MRRIVRRELPKGIQTYLARKQVEVAAKDDVESLWKKARKPKSVQAVFKCLIEMSGQRQRCMYCDDSRGTTIEHYWPKSVYASRCFLWENMLLLCQGCQCRKGSRFDLDPRGQPLLINPVDEDPWNFLFFEATTGILTARYDVTAGSPSPKGAHTTNSRVLPLNIEAITEGRLRTKRNLQRAIETYLRALDAGRPPNAARDDLVQAIGDNDDYGLSVWFFLRDGREESPFSLLRIKYPERWGQIELFLCN